MDFSNSRRRALQGALGLGTAAATAAPALAGDRKHPSGGRTESTGRWDKVFTQSDRVIHRKMTFRNRFGIVLAGDLYRPKNPGAGKLPALVFSGPFGAVKEQSSGLYAQMLADRRFVTLAFDPSFTGDSGGAVRNVASPDIFTEDFSAAVDQLGRMPDVDRERIGAMGSAA